MNEEKTVKNMEKVKKKHGKRNNGKRQEEEEDKGTMQE